MRSRLIGNMNVDIGIRKYCEVTTGTYPLMNAVHVLQMSSFDNSHNYNVPVTFSHFK